MLEDSKVTLVFFSSASSNGSSMKKPSN